MERICAIILAGGSGSRMKTNTPKQFLPLAGRPVLSYSLLAFQNSRVNDIIIVLAPEFQKKIKSEIIDKYNISKFCDFAPNGDERVWSVLNGLNKAEKISKSKNDTAFILIHDAARPVISPEYINSCIENVKKNKACIPGLPLKETIKKINSQNSIENTPDRSLYISVQTPQCFDLEILKQAYENFLKAQESGIQDFLPTDDASLVEKYTKYPVYIFPGNEKNIKITTPFDLKIAETYLTDSEPFSKI